MDFCCEEMRAQVERTCDAHPNRWECPDCLVSYSSRTGAFGLMIHDGGSSSIRICFCPWCGVRLAESASRSPEGAYGNSQG